MSYKQQTHALLRVQTLRYRRNFSENLRQFFFPIVVAIGIFFFSKVDGGSDLIAIYLPWGYNGFVRNIFMDIVTDKKLKHREYFKINGLRRASYYSCHMILAALKGLVVGFILLIGVMAAGPSFVPPKYWAVVFIVFELQAIANALFSFTVSIFFEDPFIGSDIVGTLFGIMGFFYFVGKTTGNRTVKILCGLLPPTAQTQGILGAAGEYPDYSISDCVWMLFVDIAVLFVIFFICDTFYGIDKETTAKYWRNILSFREKKKKKGGVKDDAATRSGSAESSPPLENNDFSSASYHEKFPNSQGLRKTVEITDLKKKFRKSLALKGITVSMYEKQIFCLLGHNGAGKTTSINILTGFTKASSGSVKYYGKDLKKFYSEIKMKIGVCPQTDLCYPYLTCEENLEIIAAIRGIPKKDLSTEVEIQLKKVRLYDDRKKFAGQLSGGNRRKLSMSMALLGGTEILYFDEPTSAMDPGSRRVIWQIIKDLRKEGKTIILTTHYLEEADELADRIGVMSSGKLFALGTPNYIKKQFGVGYHLFITPKYQHEVSKTFEVLKPQLKQITESIISGALVEDQTASDVLKFSLPFQEQSKFATLFERLEQIPGLALSLEMNSLEDAFLNITVHEDKKAQATTDPNLVSSSTSINLGVPKAVTKQATYNFWAQLNACFVKRFLVTIRSPQGYFSVIQPIAFIITATILPNTVAGNNERRVATFAAFIAVGFTANSSIYCGSAVYDREKRTKYLLRVMGCKNLSYWLGTFLFDFLIICFFVGFLIILIYAQKLSFIVGDLATFVGLTFGFVASLLTSAYLWGYIYSSAAAAVSTFPVLGLVVLYLGPMFLASLFNLINLHAVSIVFQVIGYALGPWLPYQQSLFALNPEYERTFFGLVLIDNALWIMLILYCQAIAYMVLTLLLEFRWFHVTVKDHNEKIQQHDAEEPPIGESDIKAEETRLLDPTNNFPIKVLNLKKRFKNGHRALKGISFGVEKGQIFGLLGPNGAGKSTAFNIITQLINGTSGEVYLNGRSIASKNKFEIYKNCGICPQFDALWELLTVKEHLEIIGKIKGLTRADLKANTDYFLDILKIREHKDKKTFQLSGGNKRRLCVALASTGAPITQFLDEPSTGMDPLARTYLWDTIKQNLAIRDSAIVLTTHSMTEAESLCSKIGILINGKFVCIGNTAYLKNKYGSGYKITVSKGAKLEGEMIDLIRQISPTATKAQDDSEIYETYQMPPDEFRFSVAFSKLEKFKNEEKIKDFSIYNTTLEQVFLEFSKQQIPEVKDEQKTKKKRCFGKKK